MGRKEFAVLGQFLVEELYGPSGFAVGGPILSCDDTHFQLIELLLLHGLLEQEQVFGELLTHQKRRLIVLVLAKFLIAFP